jgi:phospholipid/cholesterol/gamma-HCH transport system ATP-binding protein
MESRQPIVEVANALVLGGPEGYAIPPVTLRLLPGEFALVDTNDPQHAAWFADLCCGFHSPVEGTVRFLGHDWTTTTPDFAAALRGRIGRIFGRAGWIEFLDISTNILLPQLHHTWREEPELREEAAHLAMAFGLPGLPMGRPSDLSAKDLARAACIRAFLGEPALLILESPLQGRFGDLIVPILDVLTSARQRGAAAIWLTGSDLVWPDRSVPVTHRLRLREYGLVTAGRAA